MSEVRTFLIHHGPPVVFVVVLIEQLGIPAPAVPWLLAAGALSAAGQINFSLAILAGMVACLMADTVWFYLGRFRGGKVLALLCRISLEPDTCVRRTQNVFTKYGWRGIIVAKFVPGVNTLTPPLAGMSGMSLPKFLFFDFFAALLFIGTFVTLGRSFSGQLEQIMAAISSIGGSALGVLVGVIVIWIALKFWQRRRILKELRTARITVDELRRILASGDPVSILDTRSNLEASANPGIEGAIHVTLDDIKKGRYDIPREREVVVYCSCPNEVTAARVSLLLRRSGFRHVRPLLGGIDEWRKHPSSAGP